MDYVKKLFQSEETRQQNEYEHAKKSCTNFELTRKNVGSRPYQAIKIQKNVSLKS